MSLTVKIVFNTNTNAGYVLITSTEVQLEIRKAISVSLNVRGDKLAAAKEIGISYATLVLNQLLFTGTYHLKEETKTVDGKEWVYELLEMRDVFKVGDNRYDD